MKKLREKDRRCEGIRAAGKELVGKIEVSLKIKENI